MATKTWLPFVDGTSKLVKKGDIIEIVSGEKITFLEIKRTKWIGRLDGKGIRVPVYRDTLETRPFATAITGFDASVLAAAVKMNDLSRGDLFSIEGKKEVYMFKDAIGNQIHATCIASGKKWRIDPSFTLIKIDIDKIKSTL